MADNKIFVSPGVFTSEKDLTFVAQQVGVTTLGVVGETLKGPAFEPIFITNYEEYVALFGGLSPKLLGNKKPQYEASYIAKQYLKESNQLFVTRVLGLTGYDAGHAWVISSSANYDPSTIVTGGTCASGCIFTAEFSGTSQTVYNFTNAEAEYLYNLFGNMGGTLTTIGSSLTLPGTLTDYPEGIVFNKVNGSFTGSSMTGEVTNYDSGALTGTVSGTIYSYIATPYTEYENKVIAMVRSRGTVSNDQLFFNVAQSVNGLVADLSNTTTNPLADFTLTAFTSGLTSSLTYDVSLDSTKRNYLPRVIGSTCSDKTTEVWVEEI